MKIIPLLYFKKRKIYTNTNKEQISTQEIINSIEKETNVYFIDYDGIEKNKPNFCTYQRISSHYKLWVDYGPRSIGDIFDIVMAGVLNITIRKNLIEYLKIESIKNVIENPIYEYFTINKSTDISTISASSHSDGVILHSDNTSQSIEKNNDALVINNVMEKYQVNIIEPDEKNFSYWKKKGAASVITDFTTWKKVKKNEY
ncbi:MAG: hypothetical protein R6V50_01985 [Thermoplasmatota archaeon]